MPNLTEMLADMPDPKAGESMVTAPRDGETKVMIWQHRHRDWVGPYTWDTRVGGMWRGEDGHLYTPATDMLRWKPAVTA